MKNTPASGGRKPAVPSTFDQYEGFMCWTSQVRKPAVPSTYHKRNRSHAATCQRQGLALVVAIVCLVLISLSVAALLQIARAQLLHARRGEDRLQSAWLAESAVERAAVKLAADPGYRGETWEITAEDLGRKQPGEVAIQVEPIADQSARKQITAVARFPSSGDRMVQTTKAIAVRTE